MNLQELREKGGIVPPGLVKKSIEWKHRDDSGEEVVDTFDVHIARVSFGIIENLIMSAANDAKDNPEDKRAINAALIAESVRLGDEGKERISYTDAYQLHRSLGTALVRAVTEVNSLGEDAKN